VVEQKGETMKTLMMMMSVGMLCVCATAKTSAFKMPEVSTGSGFFVTKSGYLITNYHVVDGGENFSVITTNDQVEAKLIKADPATDLALLKVEGSFEACTLAKRRIEKLGTQVFTMGFPQPGLQGFSPKVTKGVVSGTDGMQGDVRHYQIDASAQPGNSGGPLFDQDGHVVGVVDSGLIVGQVVNYAIKKAYLRAFLDSANVCTDEIEESDSVASGKLEDVVDKVRSSCALVVSYK